MDLSGLTDSFVTLSTPANNCGSCDSCARIGPGLCLSCLLRVGIDHLFGEDKEINDLFEGFPVGTAQWRIGNYEILEEIGRGGMGVIYRARQRHSRRIVALKRVLGYHADSPETLARFRREAQAAASLDHPNILPIYEVGESNDRIPYFSMKFAAAGSLQEAARALHDNPREVVRLLSKVTRAIQYAHRQGILHRDLKPGNILLDARGEPLVSDFGLAKWLDSSSELTRTLTIFGTPGYIAPEQADGPARTLMPTADIYSLGAILFDLLAGRPPFLGEHALAVIRQAAEKTAPKLRSLVKGADRDLETICARCLEREPGMRYQSADGLAEDLERWLEGRPIVARPISTPQRLWRWAKRNPVLSTASVAIVGLITLAINWQVNSRRLAAEVLHEQLAAHSIAVIPFLNLDSANADLPLAMAVGRELESLFSHIGPATVRVSPQLSSQWTGGGIEDEVQEAAGRNNTRFVMSGTTRQFLHGYRMSLHLWSGSDGHPIQEWIIESKVDQNIQDDRIPVGPGIASEMYRSFENRPAAEKEIDPVLKSATARAFYLTGRDLIGRRTVVDLDRAISCFEGAVSAEPKSIVARSYLAMACMGRELLSPRAGLWEKAFQAAQQAQEMSPKDPATNRGLCFLYAAIGSNRKALEYALSALELGDTSERVFGQIGNVWKGLGDPKLAILWYQKAKVSTRQPADYDALLGDCWADLGRDKEAEDAYSAAMRYRPDLADGWVGLCRLKLLQGDTKGARSFCQLQMPSYLGSPLSKQMAARVEFFSRNYPEAERLYRELAASSSDNNGLAGAYADLDCNSALAAIRLHAGDRAEAETLLQKCMADEKRRLSRAPDNPESLYRLSAAAAIAGETDSAYSTFRKAIQSGWTDYRSPLRDPRFEQLSEEPAFKKLIDDLARRMTGSKIDELEAN